MRPTVAETPSVIPSDCRPVQIYNGDVDIPSARSGFKDHVDVVLGRQHREPLSVSRTTDLDPAYGSWVDNFSNVLVVAPDRSYSFYHKLTVLALGFRPIR